MPRLLWRLHRYSSLYIVISCDLGYQVAEGVYLSDTVWEMERRKINSDAVVFDVGI